MLENNVLERPFCGVRQRWHGSESPGIRGPVIGVAEKLDLDSKPRPLRSTPSHDKTKSFPSSLYYNISLVNMVSILTRLKLLRLKYVLVLAVGTR